MVNGNCLNQARVGGGPPAHPACEDRLREYGGGESTQMKSKARLKIASLNVRGYGGGGEGHGPEKWRLINQIIRDKKIAVLAMQEAHINRERALELEKLFGPSLVIWCAPDPENELGAKGVAFAINRRILRSAEVKMKTIIPGRAALLIIQWSADRVLKILNVYGPNSASENANFWDSLRQHGLGRIDIMTGDFNIVEESADRLPQREDQRAPAESLGNLKKSLNMLDGWRRMFPTKRAYTYMQTATGSQSRLDRIYIRREMVRDADDWTIEESGIRTDHSMVSVTVENYKAPFVGRGRWAMPVHLLNDKKLVTEMKKIGRELVDALNDHHDRTTATNPQTIYNAFKQKLTLVVRGYAKEKIPKMQRRINRLTTTLEEILSTERSGDEANTEETLRVAADLRTKIAEAEQKRFGWRRRDVAAKHWAQAETLTRYWTKANISQ
ncbi:Endonuclease/exonuclease/phosphatase, partial [Trametes maxima]